MDEQPTTPLAPEKEEMESHADADNAAAPRLGRRGFLRGLGGSLATATLGAGLLANPAAPDAGAAEPQNGANGSAEDAAALPGATASVTLTVNGTRRTVKVDPRRTLLEMLRSDLDLTGTKLVCDHGSCGACTVLMDGRPVYSCMTLALDAEGKKIDTVEGLAKGEKLHPLQAAFVEHDALMCGFCTPGFLMSSKALLDKNPRPTLEDVKNACAGNLCRCGTYPRIFEAVLDASNRKA
jgi:aerobic-type carbon monoxide dehydrogenase small subunit (CoxS/CutS family)